MVPTPTAQFAHAQNVMAGPNNKGCPAIPAGDKFYLPLNGWKAGNNQVCLPYMAGKISSCNFRDTITKGKSAVFFNNADKAIAGKQFIGKKYSTCRKVHFHVHSITPFAWQVKIVVGG